VNIYNIEVCVYVELGLIISLAASRIAHVHV